jgi:hypothetical protein
MGSVTLDFKTLSCLKTGNISLYWHCKAPSIGLSLLACECEFTQYAM